MTRNDYYAQYTVTLQELIEREKVEVFNFDYTSNYKEDLERRFINKYYFREIAYETYSMWHFKFKERWVNRINHYNTLFEKYKDIDPLLDYQEVREYVSKEIALNNEGSKGSMSGKGTGTSKDVQRDTPITAYDNNDYVSFVGSTENSNNSEQSSEVEVSKDSNKDITDTETKTIMNENVLKRLNAFVKDYVDIQERFINEFVDLFMLIY